MPGDQDVSDRAMLLRLARVCERKAKGKLQIDEEVHDHWRKARNGDRLKLAHTLAACDYDKDWSYLRGDFSVVL